MSDQSTFQVGGFIAPLTAATTNSLLQDADPAIYHAIRFYQAVLSIHLGARWDAEVTKAGLSQYVGKISTLGIPFDPLPFLQQGQLEPPYLALFVPGETWSDRTRAWYQGAGACKLQWVLPPLTLAQYHQLSPFLRAAAKVITDRTNLGYDPSYQSGALFCQLGGIEQLDLGPVQYGTLQGLNANLFFPTLEFALTIFERREATPGLQTLAGVDGSLAVTDGTGGNPITVITYKDDTT